MNQWTIGVLQPAAGAAHGVRHRLDGFLLPHSDRSGDSVMSKDRSKDKDDIGVDDICIDDLDRALNPIGRFYRHNAMHAGTTRMVLDEFRPLC